MENTPARDAECYRVGGDPWAVCTEFKTAANKAAIARSWNYYGAGAQNADVYHVVCTIAILGYRADLAALWGR